MKITLETGKEFESMSGFGSDTKRFPQHKCSCSRNPGPTGECVMCRGKISQTAKSTPLLQRRQLTEEEGQEPAVERGTQETEDTGQGVSSSGATPQSPLTSTEGISLEEHDLRKPKREVVQRKELSGPSAKGRLPRGEEIRSQLGSGTRLDSPTRTRMELFFGADLDTVRVYTNTGANSLARRLGAQAFTIGNDVAFGAGYYQPQRSSGQWLIAHEITHVLQQQKSSSGRSGLVSIGRKGDVYEREADRLADESVSFAADHEHIAVATRSGTAGLATTSGFMLQMFNNGAAAAYARQWAQGTNPTYGRFDNDCTSFVSQAMKAGGWPMIGGSFSDRANNDVWWYGRSLFSTASYTWGGAQNFANFLNARSAGTQAADPKDLQEGDVLQMKFQGSSRIGHSMVVTGKSPEDLFLSYHSRNHADEPLSDIRSRNEGATFIPWQISDPNIPPPPRCTPGSIGPGAFLTEECRVIFTRFFP